MVATFARKAVVLASVLLTVSPRVREFATGPEERLYRLSCSGQEVGWASLRRSCKKILWTKGC
jgi:hypothetical protein